MSQPCEDRRLRLPSGAPASGSTGRVQRAEREARFGRKKCGGCASLARPNHTPVIVDWRCMPEVKQHLFLTTALHIV